MMGDPHNVESWCEVLAPYTFPSQVFSLSVEEAKAICSSHQRFRQRIKLQGDQKDKDESTVLCDIFESEILKELMNKIDVEVQKFGSAFVRLGTRSPKDVALCSSDLIKKLKEELKISHASIKVKENAEVIALIRACSSSLCVTSGSQGVKNLIQSERIFNDLTMALLMMEGSSLHINVIIRKWIEIDPIKELRCFIYDKKLTAITQYFQTCVVDDFINNQENIKHQVLELHQNIQPKIKLSQYIMDVAWTEDRMWLVEINPWGITTGSSLFDWEKDIELLQNGFSSSSSNSCSSPTTCFRFLHVLPEDVKGKLAAPLRQIMMNEMIWTKLEVEEAVEKEKKKRNNYKTTNKQEREKNEREKAEREKAEREKAEREKAEREKIVSDKNSLFLSMFVVSLSLLATYLLFSPSSPLFSKTS